MTDIKKTKATVKTAPAKKATKPSSVPVKASKEVTVSKVKPLAKTPSVAVTKPVAKVPVASVKKLTPKKIEKKQEPSIKKIEVPRSEVSSFMHEMQKQAL